MNYVYQPYILRRLFAFLLTNVTPNDIRTSENGKLKDIHTKYFILSVSVLADSLKDTGSISKFSQHYGKLPKSF